MGLLATIFFQRRKKKLSDFTQGHFVKKLKRPRLLPDSGKQPDELYIPDAVQGMGERDWEAVRVCGGVGKRCD